MIFKVMIDGIDYSQFIVLPLRDTITLDESLDTAEISLRFMERQEPFKPLSAVDIQFIESGEVVRELSFFVAVDNVVKQVRLKRYDHTLSLVEQTKWLERIVMDNITVRQPLIHDYTSSATRPYPNMITGQSATDSRVQAILSGDDTADKQTGVFMSWIEEGHLAHYSGFLTVIDAYKGFFRLPLPSNVLDNTSFKSQNVKVYENGVKVLDFSTGSAKFIELNASSIYEVVYDFEVYIIGTTITERISFSVNFAVINQPEYLPFISITDTVNKLLSIYETRRVGSEPLVNLVFNTEQSDKYNERNEEDEPIFISPEFTFSGMTLRECLDQVAGAVHCITRLKDGVIYFDELGGDEQIELTASEIGESSLQDIEQYCSAIDSNAENLINTSKDDGTIIEPFYGGYKTLRTEEGTVRITDDTAIIETAYPIERVDKLIIGYINNASTGFVGDITPYVYEFSEYNNLSSYQPTYPYSKAYAIYYQQGQKNIQGFTFKLPDAISQAFQQYSLINIIEMVTGNYDLNTFFNIQNFVGLSYKLTYTPVVSARTKQSKSNLTEFDTSSTIIYNQTANKLDSQAFGENLKGAIARLGNIELFKTYLFPSVDFIPKKGALIDDDYYISTVDCESYRDFIKCTIGLSKDFNRWNKYVGIKSDIRQYEVTVNGIADRRVIYEDYGVFSFANKGYDPSDVLLTMSGANLIGSIISGLVDEAYMPASLARAVGVSADNTQLRSVDLPTVSLGLGNSILFAFKYADNYSAGNTSEVAPTSKGYYRVQNYVPYGDIYGRVENLGIKIMGKPLTIYNYAMAQEIGNALPASFSNEIAEGSVYLDTTDKPIILKKDSGESISFTAQMHFITDDDSIIIGTAFGNKNPLVSNYRSMIKWSLETRPKLYILPNKIKKFEKTINIENAELQVEGLYAQTYSSTAGFRMHIYPIGSSVSVADGEAWAIVDPTSKELLFGRNIKIKKGDNIEMPKIFFTHSPIKKYRGERE